MKKNIYITIVVFILILNVISCGNRKDSNLTTTTIELDNSNTININFDDINSSEDVKLSDIIEDLEIIKLDNSTDALFKSDWAFFSDKYIVVRDGARDKRPAKIFDKNGRYIAPVGNIGRGPGEYLDVFDILVDETSNFIYLTQMSSRVVNQYDMRGNLIKEIKLGTSLNKPRLYANANGTISIVNLCFNDQHNSFIAATVNPSTDEQIFLACPELGTNFVNKKGAGVGFDNEIFSYRNSMNNTFKFSYNDNLFKYDPANNRISAILEFTLPENLKENHWCVYNDFPEFILVHVIGPKGRTIKVSKMDGTAVEIKLVNDFMGGIDTGMSFQDGYYFKIYEPRSLKEIISKFIKTKEIDKKTEESLLHLINTINNDDNNILLIGKLKS